eukprot:CAMPEP_0170466482 /NCGR_PEP_ID=MMETSP0123-20130129/10428_1 /TAXON_ID=182087 /ORGANISM="Favella ehrenbergii, Strain Fehren 1" /LENGTH=121 /DNA_ID=CAMNT_0010732627 /DNA_START=352 /DNA_END=717 /DNA_ORIENTATION=-
MLDANGPTNLYDTFIFKKGVVNWKQMSDIWYKRILTDVLLRRERQIEFLASHLEQTREPKLRRAKARFADSEDSTPLLMSFAVGALLLAVVQFGFPTESQISVVSEVEQEDKPKGSKAKGA